MPEHHPKKRINIRNTAKVLNQEWFISIVFCYFGFCLGTGSNFSN